MSRTEKREWGWRGDANERRRLKGDDYERELFGAYVPRDFERGAWGNRGEMAKWLRVKGAAGRSNWLVVLVSHLHGSTAPRVERLSNTSARLVLGDESEIVHLSGRGNFQAALERYGKLTILLDASEIKPWSELSFQPVPPTRSERRQP